MSSFNGREIDEPDKMERMEYKVLVYNRVEVPLLVPMGALLLISHLLISLRANEE